MERVKITIIGAGVIGLSIAYELSKFTSDIIVLEKNDSFGQESSSRNSEVIHSGLYYLPDSLKANTCIRGNRLLYDFCSKHNIAHKKLGKLVVACDNQEIAQIEDIYKNACKSGVKNLFFLEPSEIKKLEPNVVAKKAFFCPDSGILDTHALMNFFYNSAKGLGVTFAFFTEAVGIEKKNSEYKVTVKEAEGGNFSFQSQIIINCAGLYTDRVAAMVGIDTKSYGYDINYCRGQYFRIKNPKKFSIGHLVYPPATEISLGIHITLDLGQGLRLGPDAKYISEINYTLDEADRNSFYESIAKFLPTLEIEDLLPDTVGIRPKLQKEGESFRDFVINEENQKGFERFINCLGIESPGITSCLAIAEIVKEFVKNS